MATAIQQAGFKRVKRGYKPLSVDNLVPLYEIKNPTNPANKDPTDPFFKYQWYLKNVGQNGGKPKLDLNVEAAWAQGVTGKNVTTAIMDDGTWMRERFLSLFLLFSRKNLRLSRIFSKLNFKWHAYLRGDCSSRKLAGFESISRREDYATRVTQHRSSFSRFIERREDVFSECLP